jgi:indolepyruvate ferredoxin oxidoreductase alpha subunit
MSFSNQILGTKSFSAIVMGIHALVRAMVEARVEVVKSYPGSPTSEIANAIKAVPTEKRPFYFEFSTNEKVATEVTFGASINGHFSTVFFKSVGLNVAAEAFVQLSHMKLKGGMVVVIGEDSGANSSQNEQDNRHLAYLSKQLEMPVILRMSTHVCHAKARVQFGEYKPDNSIREPGFDPDSYNYLPITIPEGGMKPETQIGKISLSQYPEHGGR